MAFIHGKGQAVTIDGDSLTAYSNSVTYTRTADSHDVTCFGRTAKNYQSGLKDGTATIEGTYDSTTVTGPGAIFKPLIGGGQVDLVWEPEGIGSGKEKSTVAVIVTQFEQTAPVADMITWSAEVQFCEDVDDTPQT